MPSVAGIRDRMREPDAMDDEPNNGHELCAKTVSNADDWHISQRGGIGLTRSVLTIAATNVNTAPIPRPI